MNQELLQIKGLRSKNILISISSDAAKFQIDNQSALNTRDGKKITVHGLEVLNTDDTAKASNGNPLISPTHQKNLFLTLVAGSGNQQVLDEAPLSLLDASANDGIKFTPKLDNVQFSESFITTGDKSALPAASTNTVILLVVYYTIN